MLCFLWWGSTFIFHDEGDDDEGDDGDGDGGGDDDVYIHLLLREPPWWFTLEALSLNPRGITQQWAEQ